MTQVIKYNNVNNTMLKIFRGTTITQLPYNLTLGRKNTYTLN
jgi:hypothetical protein